MPTVSRYTKRQYERDIQANDLAKADVRALIAALSIEAERGVTDDLTERFNAAHDREYSLEQDRRNIECRWIQRHWTASDYAALSLAAQNID